MPGIADIQPKQLSSLGVPLAPDIEPVTTAASTQQLLGLMGQGMITAEDIRQRIATRKVAEQTAKEMIDPEAIKARQEQQRLTAAKAAGERETLLSKDFVSAYLRYNLPLKKADGTPDYSGMAEVGQKYADMERVAKYAEGGLKGNPVQSIDDKDRTVTRFINAYGEDITEVPGKVNPTVRDYQKMMRKARAFLLQNDNEPEVPEGKEPPKIEVSPKIDPFSTATVPVTVEPQPTFSQWKSGLPPFPPNESDPAQVRAWLYSAKVMPQSAAAVLTDQDALETYRSYKEHLMRPETPEAAPMITAVAPTAAAVPAVEPEISPTVAETPTVYAGEGLVTGKGSFDPDKFVTDIRATGMYKNWEEKSPFIGGFRSLVADYAKTKPGDITTQKDIELATYALLLSTPGSSAGGRGMEGLRLTKLEDSQPLLEQLMGIKAHVLKEHKFEEGTRERIIEAANRKIQVLESQGRSAVKNATERLRAQGYDPNEFLLDPEKQLVGSVGAEAPSAATQPRGTLKTLSSGRKIIGY